MEANKESAYQCLVRARSAFEKNDFNKAHQLAIKSLRLYPTQEADEFVTFVKKAALKNTQAQAQAAPTPNPTTPNIGMPPPGADYTMEDMQIVAKINQAKTHYDVLGAHKETDEKTIKIAYRKLSLQCHPDKNKAPGAEEAFKRVSAAFQCLSNGEKKKMYDLYGDDDAVTQQRAQQRQQYYNMGTMDDELRPEDIFNMFFSGQFNGQGPFRRRPFTQTRHTYSTRNQRQTAGAQTSNMSEFSLSSFIHIIPILLLIFFSFFSLPSSEETHFSMRRTTESPVQRLTKAYSTPYYVNPSFNSRFARDERSLYTLERQVERENFAAAEEGCRQQRAQKEEARRKARTAKRNPVQALHTAESMPETFCEQLPTLRERLS